jgi:1,4-dihydroxy-2-naphthoate polyprenyltransferase
MTSNDPPKLNRWQIWWLAARPKTLPASLAGVVTGIAVALWEGRFRPFPALAALLVGLLLQIGSNLANDVFDFERGADTSGRHGPLRVTQAGLLTPAQVKRGMWVVFGLAGLLGVYLAWVAGWPVILIGVAAIASAIAYTGGPFPLGYYGLGDLFVFLFFGVAAVAGTYFVQAKMVSPAAWWMSVPIGLLVVDILVVNNLRDIDTDRAAGKFTLAVRFGAVGTRRQYLVCIAAAYLLIPLLAWSKVIPPAALLTWLSLPLAWRVTRTVFTQGGRLLNPALANTGQLALVYSLLFLTGMLVS